jgi:hypothetical protein
MAIYGMKAVVYSKHQTANIKCEMLEDDGICMVG